MSYDEEVFDFSLETDDNTRQYLIVVVYDIPDNKRRNRMAKTLKSYGLRVQKSVFECMLTNKLYQRMILAAEKILAEEDYLRIYKLSARADIRAYSPLGLLEFDEDYVII